MPEAPSQINKEKIYNQNVYNEGGKLAVIGGVKIAYPKDTNYFNYFKQKSDYFTDRLVDAGYSRDQANALFKEAEARENFGAADPRITTLQKPAAGSLVWYQQQYPNRQFTTDYAGNVQEVIQGQQASFQGQVQQSTPTHVPKPKEDNFTRPKPKERDILREIAQEKGAIKPPDIIQKSFQALPPESQKKLTTPPPIVHTGLPPASFGRDVTAHDIAQAKGFPETEKQLAELAGLQAMQVREVEKTQREKANIPKNFGLSDARVAAINNEMNAAVAIVNAATTQEEFDAAKARYDVTVAAAKAYNLRVLQAEGALFLLSQKERKQIARAKTVGGAYEGIAGNYEEQVKAYNKAIFAPKPNVLPPPEKRLRQVIEERINVARSEFAKASHVQAPGVFPIALADIVFGVGGVGTVEYGKQLRKLAGIKEKKTSVPVSTKTAFEYGVAARRPVSYVAPLVFPVLAPLMYGTALTDISQAKTWDEAILPAASFVPFVAGYKVLGSAPGIARFFGATGKYGTALAKGGEMSGNVVEKLSFPIAAGIAAGYSTLPVMQAIQARDYAQAHELERQMGVQFASYTIGGAGTQKAIDTSGMLLKNFVTKPSTKVSARIGAYGEETANVRPPRGIPTYEWNLATGKLVKRVPVESVGKVDWTVKIRTDTVSQKNFFNRAKLASLQNFLNPRVGFTKKIVSGETNFFAGPATTINQRLVNLNTRYATKMFLETGKSVKAPAFGETFEITGAGKTHIKTAGYYPKFDPLTEIFYPGVKDSFTRTKRGGQTDVIEMPFARMGEKADSFFEFGKLRQVSRAKPTKAGKALKPFESAFSGAYRLNWREFPDITEFSGVTRGRAFARGQKPIPIEITISKSHLKTLEQQGIGLGEGGKSWTSYSKKSGSQTLMKNLVKQVSGTVAVQATKGVQGVSFKGGAGASQAGFFLTRMNTRGGLYYGLYGIAGLAPTKTLPRQQSRIIYYPSFSNIFGSIGKAIVGQPPKYKQAPDITELLMPAQTTTQKMKQAQATRQALQTITIIVPKPVEFTKTPPRPPPFIPLFGIPRITGGGFFWPRGTGISEKQGGRARKTPFYFNELFAAFGIKPMPKRTKKSNSNFLNQIFGVKQRKRRKK